jgi:hypothetical protein
MRELCISLHVKGMDHVQPIFNELTAALAVDPLPLCLDFSVAIFKNHLKTININLFLGGGIHRALLSQFSLLWLLYLIEVVGPITTLIVKQVLQELIGSFLVT